LKCRGNGHCEVTVETRKRCKKCRLDKCFRMGKNIFVIFDILIIFILFLGMRKEWILSDEQYVYLIACRRIYRKSTVVFIESRIQKGKLE